VATVVFFNGRKSKGSDHPTTYKTLRSVKRLINYIMRVDKTQEALIGAIYCNPQTAYDEFIMTKAIYNKLPTETLSKHNEVVHMVLSFKGQEASPELAKTIADQFIQEEKFKGFQVVYAVHTDTDDVHAHFAINTVSYETGLRWHISRNEVVQLIEKANEISRDHNLSVVKMKERSHEGTHNLSRRLSRNISSGEYRARINGRSWKAETLHAGLAAKRVTKSKDEFIDTMKSMGYKIRWEENRKDITFTNREGKKINSDKLGFPDRNYNPLTKEALEKQFALNRQVKENENKTVIFEKDQIQNQILKLAKDLTKDNTNHYPFQNSNLKPEGLDGQSYKDMIKELEKGKGLNWERE
jgi:hypothetical protein